MSDMTILKIVRMLTTDLLILFIVGILASGYVVTLHDCKEEIARGLALFLAQAASFLLILRWITNAVIFSKTNSKP